MDQALAALHAGNPDRLPVDFILGRIGSAVTLLCRFPPELRSVVEGQLYAQYPDAALELLPDGALHVAENMHHWYADLRLRTSLFPIRDYRRFEDALNRVTADPLSALLATLTRGRGQSLHAWIELTVRPLRSRLRKRAERCLARIGSSPLRHHPRLAGWYGELGLSSSWNRRILARLLGWLARGGRRAAAAGADPEFSSARDKLGRQLFEAGIRLHVAGSAEAGEQVERALREIAGAFGDFGAAPWAVFRRTRLRRTRPGADRVSLFPSCSLPASWPPSGTRRRRLSAPRPCRASRADNWSRR